MFRSLLFVALLTPVQPADYQQCRRIHNGPIHRLDNYAPNPHLRQRGIA